MSAHGRPSPLVMHVHEIGMIVEVWREGVGWWAATARGRSRRGYFTPEAALRALTGSWPHEPWLARVGAAARHRAGSAHEAAAGKRDARRHAPGTLVAIRETGPTQAHSATPTRAAPPSMIRNHP